MRLVCIVEGHGDVAAVPVLIRRLLPRGSAGQVELPRPIRIPKTKLVQEKELARAIELAARQTGAADGILVVLDADEDCPRLLAGNMLATARRARPDRRIAVVLAKQEFENWFLAAAESLASRRGLSPDLMAPADPEGIRDAKAWLGSRMGGPSGYRETIDQPAMAAAFDLDLATARSRSFAKLRRDVERLVAGPV